MRKHSSTQKTSHRTRLSVEPLEDRAVPANFTAANVPELIAAMDAANASAEADTITLAAGHTFTLTELNNQVNGSNGLPVVAAVGGPLTIIGNGSMIERSANAGTPQFRIIAVDSGATLELEHLTLQGGVATGMSYVPEKCLGGAVYNKGALILDEVTIQNNKAIGNQGGPAGLGGFIVAFAGRGGGIYSSGVLSISNSTFTDNTAVGGVGIHALTGKKPTGGVPEYIPLPWVGGTGGDGLGGGVYVADGVVTISDTSFTSNTAIGGAGGNGFLKKNGERTNSGDGGIGHGGGMYVHGGTVTLYGVSVKQNSALAGEPGVGPNGQAGKGIGGGLYIFVDADVGMDAFTDSHIKNNDATTNHKNIHGNHHLIS